MNQPRLPDFVIIGAQKSASTFVQDALSSHPDIYMPAGETRFFEDPEYGAGKVSELAGIFAGRREAQLGIKRPDYLGRVEVPARIRAHLPDARIIVVLRNPIDRLVSAYYFYIKLGFLPVLDINEAIPKLLDGQTLGSVKSAELLSYGRYATHLRRYREAFPQSQMHILFQEDIQKDPAGELSRLCRFLGLRPEGMGTLPPSANTGVYPLSRLRFLGWRNKFLYEYDAVTGKILQKKVPLWNFIPAAALTLFDRWILAKVVGNQKPRLNDAVRQSLADYYRDEITGTAEITGRSLQSWH